MRLDMLYHHCAEIGLEVVWADLGPVRRGEYLDDRRLVRMNHRLTRAQATATLAHEVGHAAFGDRCATVANERRAWEYGASLIIEPWEYAAAEDLVGCHPAAIAEELGVTPYLVLAWRRWWDRR